MIFSRAAGSPARSASKAAASSLGDSGRGKLPDSRCSARYKNWDEKNCSKASSMDKTPLANQVKGLLSVYVPAGENLPGPCGDGGGVLQ